MTSHLISIVVPAYNIAPYIEDCLDSILAQTYRNIEIVVVDDGSSDGTGEVLDRYAAEHDRVRVIHKANGGVTSARLCGVENARGEWIGFVDGDDRIEPDMYARLWANAEEAGADISHCGYRMVFPGGRVDWYYNRGTKLVRDNAGGVADLVSGEFIEPGLVIKLFRRGLFEKLVANGIDTGIRINEDLLMNYYLFKESSVSVYEDFCPYHYVLRGGSASTSGLNEHKLRDPLKVARIIFEDASPAVRPTAYAKLVRTLVAGATVDTSDRPELTLPFKKECRAELRSCLGDILGTYGISARLKAMAAWAAAWPASYRFVHSTYAKMRGLDKKYDLN